MAFWRSVQPLCCELTLKQLCHHHFPPFGKASCGLHKYALFVIIVIGIIKLKPSLIPDPGFQQLAGEPKDVLCIGDPLQITDGFAGAFNSVDRVRSPV